LSASTEAAGGPSEASPGTRTGRASKAVVAELIEHGTAACGTRSRDRTIADGYMIGGALSAVIRTGSGDRRRFVGIMPGGLRLR
jgi:hypothetical protein